MRVAAVAVDGKDAALRATVRTRFPAPAIAAAVLLSASGGALAATTATKPKGDVVKGKALFLKTCGPCHRLAAARTKGRVGPNLTGDRIDYSVAVWVITNGLSLMPGYKGQLKPTEIRDLAAYVAEATKS